MHALSDEVRYRLLTYLAGHPHASQREVARELGISVGKANYCVRALVEKGWVKLRNFTGSENKSVYAYVLTPSGIDAKIRITCDFLRRKIAEYDQLSREIELLRAEVGDLAEAELTPQALSDTERRPRAGGKEAGR